MPQYIHAAVVAPPDDSKSPISVADVEDTFATSLFVSIGTANAPQPHSNNKTGALVTSPSYDIAVLVPAPFNMNASELPSAHPPRFTTSCTRSFRSGVRSGDPASSPIQFAGSHLTDVVVTLLDDTSLVTSRKVPALSAC